MDKVYFCNNGEFNVKAMMTFGVSAKEGEDAIGYFGTGFKYAVAIILRLGGSIKIETCGETYVFERRREEIRGKSFDLVLMNGNDAGFTTRLGINWLPWMAFRELYCNCIDEKGEVSEIPVEMDTIIEVDCPEIYNCYADRSDYFLDTTPIYTHPMADIHPDKKPFIYYRGVAVLPVEGSIYSYNIKKKIDLTEDRTVRYQWDINHSLGCMLQSLTDISIIRKVFSNIDSFESKIGLDVDRHTSDELLTTVEQMLKTEVGACPSARDLVKKIDTKKGNWPEVYLTKTQLMMLEKAKKFLFGISVNIDDFEIKIVSGLGDGVMGMAKDGFIYLSEKPFQMGTKQVASTLIEEWVHNKYGCKDFDRNMQNWLFDKILSIGEELNGEPL